MLTQKRISSACAALAAGFGAENFDEPVEATNELERLAAEFVAELDRHYGRELDAAASANVRLVLMNAALPFYALAFQMTIELAKRTGSVPLDVLRSIERALEATGDV